MYRRILRSIAFASLTILTAAPAFAQVRADVGPLHIRIATDAPPRARSERRPPRPDRDAVWLNGYWDRQGDQWVWTTGRWERPAAANVRWVRAKYVREGNAWRYEPARWSNQQVDEGEDYQRWKQEHHDSRHH
jgi:hypothetical protein